MDIFFLSIISIVLLVAVSTSFFIVQPKQVATVTRLGRFVRVGRPGLNFKLPLGLESVDRRLSTALQSMSHEIRVKTSDNAFVDMPIQVFFEVDSNRVEEAAYNLEDPEEQIMRLASKEVRSRANDMALEQLYKDKDTFEKDVLSELEEFLTANGFKVRNVVVDEPMPDAAVQDASNQVIASQRLTDAARNRAEAIKAERIGEATADAEALKKRAQAFAESRDMIARGMVDAAKTLNGGVSGLSHQEVIAVLEGVDHRDMLISCSKGKGTLIIDSPSGNSMAAMSAALFKGLPAVDASRSLASSSAAAPAPEHVAESQPTETP